MAFLLAAVKSAVAGPPGSGGPFQAAPPPPPPPPNWLTRLTQCDPPAKMEEWFFAFFCFHCAQAAAKEKADGTHCLYNLLTWHHIGTYSWIRRAYNIPGQCGDDLMCGIFCWPCTIRQIVTETTQRQRSPVAIIGNTNNGQWFETLFGCDCCGIIQAATCPFCVAQETRQILQPQSNPDMCFDWMCLIPMGMYGQVRHTFDLRSDCPLIEDICLPYLCYPCALDQARREARRRAQTPEYLAKMALKHSGYMWVAPTGLPFGLR